MKMKGFSFFSKGPVRYEIPELLADRNHLVQMDFVVLLGYIESFFELDVPLGTDKLSDLCARGYLALQDGQMDKDMLSPAKKRIYGPECKPIHTLK